MKIYDHVLARGKARASLALRRTRLRPSVLVLLFRQLEMLLGAGVLISDALRSLRDRFPDPAARRVLACVHAEVVHSRGRLSQAFAQFPRSFPPSIIAMIAAGEDGGSGLLAERLADLADRVAYEDQHRRLLRRACAYPALVLSLAVGLLCFLLTVAFPRLEELLRSLGGQLPPLTRMVIATSAWARRWGVLSSLAATAAAGTAWGARRWAPAAQHIDRWLLRLPIGGSIYREFTVALFCRIYRSLYLSNQSAPEILETCTQLSGNLWVRAALRGARTQVTQRGATLSAALEVTGLFPPLVILALEVGQHSGRLADAMERTGTYLHARARERLDGAIALLNPLLTLGVVAGGGLVMIAFFQALYQVVYVAQ